MSEGVTYITQEDAMCKRCGSSTTWENCHDCGGEGVMECDPIQCCNYHPCSTCFGEGGWSLCISSAEWCLEHPRKGFEDVPRHTIESFTYQEPVDV